MIENILVLEKGLWTPDRVKLHEIAERSAVKIYPGDIEAIKERWKEILTKNKNAFPGPTIRLVGRHRLKNNLILEVVPSDYKESSVLSWLGVAMVPVTTDGCIGLQCPVESISATIGGGVRVPGCTPENTEVINHIIKEMKEEFNVKIAKNNMTIHGLMEVRPPVASLHNALVAKVKVPFDYQELKQGWETAEDRKEGDLVPLKLDYGKRKLLWKELREELRRKMGKEIKKEEAVNVQSKVILAMIAESEFGIKERGE